MWRRRGQPAIVEWTGWFNTRGSAAASATNPQPSKNRPQRRSPNPTRRTPRSPVRLTKRDTGDSDYARTGDPTGPVTCEQDGDARIAFELATAGEQLPCGQITDATGPLKIVTSGTTDQTARAVMKAYFTAIDRGECLGNGRACLLTIQRYACTVNTAATAQDTGVAARCRNGEREIQALT